MRYAMGFGLLALAVAGVVVGWRRRSAGADTDCGCDDAADEVES